MVTINQLEADGNHHDDDAVESRVMTWEDVFGSDSQSRVTLSGERVSRDKALGYAAFWRGVSRIARDVAKIPKPVYRRLDNGGKERDPRHPAFSLLMRQASPYMKAFDFQQAIVGHAIMHGNGYALIRKRNGLPIELHLLNPDDTWPVLENGVLVYMVAVQDVDGKGPRALRIPAADIFHIRGFGFDGLCGYDVIKYARETLGLGLAARKHGSIHFKKGATPNIILEHPGNLKPEHMKLLRETFRDTHMGADGDKVAVLWQNMKANVIGTDAKSSQFMELRQFEIREIANILGIPPHKIGDDSRTSYNSVEQENQDYLQDALDGWLCQFETECNAKLLRRSERRDDTHFIEARREAIVQIDTKTKVESLVTQVNNSLLTPNEARGIMNMPALGPVGDRLRRPVNHEDIDLSAVDEDTTDIDFKREIVKQYIADGTIGDVIFNLTDGRKLLEEVNLPTFGTTEEPWLPVVAADGRLVSGETIEDENGDIVGGDVVETEETEESGNSPEGLDVDMEDDEGVRAAFDEALRRSRSHVTQGYRRLVGDALGRINFRINTMARRHASDEGKYIEFVANVPDKYAKPLFEAIEPICEAMRRAYARQVAQATTTTYLAGIRHLLASASHPDDQKRIEGVQIVTNAIENYVVSAFMKRNLR